MVRFETLSRSVIGIRSPKASAGQHTGGPSFTHVVTDYPLEIHVFTRLRRRPHWFAGVDFEF